MAPKDSLLHASMSDTTGSSAPIKSSITSESCCRGEDGSEQTRIVVLPPRCLRSLCALLVLCVA